MDQIVHRVLRFDRFALDLTRGCLRRGDQDIDLPPKAFEVLRHLARNAGRLVPKQELHEVVWPHVVVSDDSVVQCIRELRRKLDDDKHRLIKTVSRRGYRLDAAISSDDVPAVRAPAVAGNAPNFTSLVDSISEPAAEEIGCHRLEGERKHVTVLCANLRDSLEVVAQHNPEKALEVFDKVLKLMTDAVDRYAGTVTVVTTDGIVALFGVPLAHEDHAVRACHAALEIQERVKQYSQRQRAPSFSIQVRAGLHSGELIVRPIVSEGPIQYAVMGRTTQLATRLEEIAAPGTSLIGAETLWQVKGHFQVAAPKSAVAACLGEPVYELVGTGPTQTRFQALAALGLTRFVGRRAEIAQLERALARAQRCHGQVVSIIGEPGVGKSRLLHEFLRSHCTPDWLLLETASVSYRATTSYQPVIDLLKSYFHIADSDDVREVTNAVSGRLLRLDRTLATDVPALLALLDIPVEEPSWQALDAFQRRQRTFEALKRLILRECQQQPVILAFEDLHCIDSETQAFLETLIDSLACAPLLLILTHRPEYEHSWGGKSYYTQLRISALPPKTTEEFLRNLLGDNASLVRLKDQLAKQGNPFFLEESVRTLVEAKLLEGQRGAYRLVGALHKLRIPATVQAILAARIDRLPARDKRLLQAASVIGKDVPLVLLREIAELPDETLRRALDHLQAAEFLYQTRLFPNPEYTFAHALSHDVAYDSLLHDRRHTLHGQVVESIERLYQDRLAEHVEQLAHHALRGEVWGKAARYFGQAGVRAAAGSALPHARDCFERALVALDALPENSSTIEEGLEIRLKMRPVLSQLGEIRQALARLREAEKLSARINDDRHRGRVSAYMANAHSAIGDLDEAYSFAVRALAIARGLGDVELTILSTAFLGQALFHRGDYEHVVALAEECIVKFAGDLIYEHFGSAALPLIETRSRLAVSLAQLGRFTEAAGYATEALQLAEPTNCTFTVGQANVAAATVHLLKEDWGRSHSLVDHGVAVLRDGNVVNVLPYAVGTSAWVWAHLHHGTEAIKLIQEGERLVEHQVEAGWVGQVGWAYYVLGRACLVLGRIEQASRLADRAIVFSPSHAGTAGHAQCLLGDIAIHPNGLGAESAQMHYRNALALAEPRGMRPLIAHCHRGLGKAYQQTGQLGKARGHLAAATRTYRDMNMRLGAEEG